MADDPDKPLLHPGTKIGSWRDQLLAKIVAHRVIVELIDLTDARRRSVEAGKTSAGTFPTGINKAKLSNWTVESFGPPK